MALGLFDYWANLTSKKVMINADAKDEVSGYSPYMINRLTSMINIYISFSAAMTKYDLPKDVHYRFWYNILPKRYIKFTYLKKTKQEDTEDVESKVAEYFEAGTRDAALIMKLLSKDDKKSICKKFGGRT